MKIWTTKDLLALPESVQLLNKDKLGLATSKSNQTSSTHKLPSVLPPSTYDSEHGVCKIVLPLPVDALRPNGRPGKWGRIKAVTAARELAAYTTIQALRSTRPMWTGANVFLTVYLTSRRASDAGNWIASCKAHEDGVADAGLVANDSGNVWQPVTVEADRCCPRVELVFRRIDS